MARPDRMTEEEQEAFGLPGGPLSHAEQAAASAEPSALDMSEDILRGIADRDRGTDSPLPLAVDAVFAELARLRAREARLVEALRDLLDAPDLDFQELDGLTNLAIAAARAALTGKESSNG